MSSLEGLVQRLGERGHKYDKRSLAQLISGLAQFMEDALGVNVSGTRAVAVAWLADCTGVECTEAHGTAGAAVD